MKYSSLQFLCIISLLFYSYQSFSQQGVVTGTLTDQDGLPLPGVTITIKGSSIGIQSDFDGNYSIACKIGDTLVYNYIGQKTKEITVTSEMFSLEKKAVEIKYSPVEKIKSSAYQKAIKKRNDSLKDIPDIELTSLSYNKNKSYLEFNRIKKIDSASNRLKISYFKPDIYYEIGYIQHFGFQFIRDRNLPEVQNNFVQGRPFNGSNTWFGADTNEIFSFGPSISILEFDGSNFDFDRNGRLVPIGNGNGQPAKRYNNTIFNTTINTSTRVHFKVFTIRDYLEINYKNNTQKDIFNTDTSSANELKISGQKRTKNNINTLKGALSYTEKTNGQPNLNGFYNNVIQTSLLTPVSFENNQGILTASNSQRSFSPEFFNNPLWLLSRNNNESSNTVFTSNLTHTTSLFERLHAKSLISYSNQQNEQNFGLPSGTIGFEEGFQSMKKFEEDFFNARLSLNYNLHLNNYSFLFDSSVDFNHENLKYRFSEQSGVGPLLNTNETRNKTVLRLLNKVALEKYADLGITLFLQNNSFLSSVQGNKWFLPTLQLYTDLHDVITYSNWLNKLSITFGYSKDANDLPLFYNNNSHNSLIISPEESQGFTANNDLFISENISLEESDNFDVNANIVLANHLIDIGFSYFSSRNKNSVFPVFESNEFKLQNVANIQNRGVEASIELNVGRWNRTFSYTSKIIFSKNRTEVQDILTDASRIPIAGFSSVSNNLIEGESAGVIVGSAFLRDDLGRSIIDDNGFPLVAPNLQIIGDPTPDFNIGFSNTFKFNRFQFHFLIDIRKGGDVWNGTQNVLNFHGRSQESAVLRDVTNFLFEGVTQSGNLNTQVVDFANPNNTVFSNRWVRYGFEGVAEEAIEDGSYINLRTLKFSYNIIRQNDEMFFRDLSVSLYAQNLFTYTKFKGATPYNNLFDHSSANGLNFFNTPLISEIGFKINIKI